MHNLSENLFGPYVPKHKKVKPGVFNAQGAGYLGNGFGWALGYPPYVGATAGYMTDDRADMNPHNTDTDDAKGMTDSTASTANAANPAGLGGMPSN